MAKMHCDQCEALMINGVFCHETGCPNSGSRWYGGKVDETTVREIVRLKREKRTARLLSTKVNS